MCLFLPSMRTSWTWWSLFLPPTPPLPQRHPQSINLGSSWVLWKYSSFRDGEQHWFEHSGIFYRWLQDRKGTVNYEKAEHLFSLFFLLLVLIFVADILQIKHDPTTKLKTTKSENRPQNKPSTIFLGFSSPTGNPQRRQIHVQTKQKKYSCMFPVILLVWEFANMHWHHINSKNVFHTPIAPKATATIKVDDLLKTPW